MRPSRSYSFLQMFLLERSDGWHGEGDCLPGRYEYAGSTHYVQQILQSLRDVLCQLITATVDALLGGHRNMLSISASSALLPP